VNESGFFVEKSDIPNGGTSHRVQGRDINRVKVAISQLQRATLHSNSPATGYI